MKRELTHGSLFSGVEGFGLGAALAGASQTGGRDLPEPFGVVFKNCEKYCYVYTDNLIY